MAKKFNTGMLQGVMDNLVIDFHTTFSGTVSTSFSGVVPEPPTEQDNILDPANTEGAAANANEALRIALEETNKATLPKQYNNNVPYPLRRQ